MPGHECLAAAGKMVQLANEEFKRCKNYAPPDSHENHASAFARAKRNRDDAYKTIHQIKARSQELRETDLQLLAEEQAAQHNTTTANALKAILKHEQDASIFPLLRSWIKGPQNGSLDELWTPDNPLDLQNTSWSGYSRETSNL